MPMASSMKFAPEPMIRQRRKLHWHAICCTIEGRQQIQTDTVVPKGELVGKDIHRKISPSPGRALWQHRHEGYLEILWA